MINNSLPVKYLEIYNKNINFYCAYASIIWCGVCFIRVFHIVDLEVIF